MNEVLFLRRFMRIAHLTSVHSRFDIRIYFKQCSSLANNGFKVSLVVADGKGDAVEGNIDIFDVGVSKGRLNRIFGATARVLNKAIEIDADIYHFHDPELIPVGLKLKRRGKIVIFDAHEDLPKQLLGKPYLNPVLLRILSWTFSVYERYVCPKFDVVVTATPFIRDKFLSIGCKAVDINNFPMIGELDASVAWGDKRPEVCYVGGISSIRGVRELVAACSYLKADAHLNLVGGVSEGGLDAEMRATTGWDRVNAIGVLGRDGVRDILGRSMAGLVTFYPLPNHVDAQPNKMFEYMSSGLPVIASNFPLWKKIIEGNKCGLCVDPLDPAAIAKAIDYIVSHPDEARAMGENGKRAVYEKYNWGVESEKLISLYRSLCNK